MSLADLRIRPRNVGGQTLVDVALIDQQEFIPLLGIHAAVGVSRLGLAEYLRRTCGACAANLVLQGHKGAALVPIGLNSIPKRLSRLTKLGMAGHLSFCALDHEPGAVGRVVGDQLLPLSDLRGQRGDEAFLLELGGDALGNLRDRLGFTLTRLLKPRGLLLP